MFLWKSNICLQRILLNRLSFQLRSGPRIPGRSEDFKTGFDFRPRGSSRHACPLGIKTHFAWLRTEEQEEEEEGGWLEPWNVQTFPVHCFALPSSGISHDNMCNGFIWIYNSFWSQLVSSLRQDYVGWSCMVMIIEQNNRWYLHILLCRF